MEFQIPPQLDILKVLERRAPQVKVIVKSVKVQGQGAAKQISEAIKLFNIANIIAEKIINILMNLEIFFAEVLANQVRRTYTTTKMISVIKKIFIY